ncbi:hypothetical protein COCC4DRAFT_32458 [Bipolaris maydis ATCC 48331]|uniref:Uncharacterized protein n=2 Tax=Cochliobolus heterostrophus TaxID=5016 RepID=M2U2K3_COCH5|nr:uncharacterized protein COCC4DRAFT_32458 [Bipolaris maydis ATCC 48331]EMD92754.1 hypothetical protein COCHEDRAFT_1020727 [Bipolaris maydis C5]ENI04858.1 hypothetical protein COCC4DRAFT_32458 [Bipolaris maydis ATCC 48331]KAJ6208386.1 hypothetical protein PSV09DRAFT_1020727 [Bipolaris maydis]
MFHLLFVVRVLVRISFALLCPLLVPFSSVICTNHADRPARPLGYPHLAHSGVSCVTS